MVLTKRQNFLETIRGGKSDRFVNQYEFLSLLLGVDPIIGASPMPTPGGPDVVNAWGVTIQWGAGQPGPFPVHDAAHKVIKDSTRWKDVVKMPRLDYPDSAWESSEKMADAIDRKEVFAAVGYTGLFEQLHYLMGIDDCLVNFYEEPEAMKELIKSHGVEIIVHHSDSYTANLVPQMIEMGIDVFQGNIKRCSRIG
ncbi:MAG: hypothetical protein LBT14_12230 [Treponema sp.]|jgi:hypothetical protein|nr:hypothetical protein [Treponema sp.]